MKYLFLFYNCVVCGFLFMLVLGCGKDESSQVTPEIEELEKQAPILEVENILANWFSNQTVEEKMLTCLKPKQSEPYILQATEWGVDLSKNLGEISFLRLDWGEVRGFTVFYRYESPLGKYGVIPFYSRPGLPLKHFGWPLVEGSTDLFHRFCQGEFPDEGLFFGAIRIVEELNSNDNSNLVKLIAFPRLEELNGEVIYGSRELVEKCKFEPVGGKGYWPFYVRREMVSGGGYRIVLKKVGSRAVQFARKKYKLN